jgi:hypothetical protein
MDKEKKKRGGGVVNSIREIRTGKSAGFFAKIIRGNPWPVQEVKGSAVDAKILSAGNSNTVPDEGGLTTRMADADQAEAVYSAECPHCGKLFDTFDEDGCLVEDFGRCEDFVGEGDDEDFYFVEKFEMLHEIQRLYLDITMNGKEGYSYITSLTENYLEDDSPFSKFLEGLGFCVDSHEWFGGGPGLSGNFAHLTIHRELQSDLQEKLQVMKNRLEAFSKSEDEIMNRTDFITNMIEAYGTKVPVSSLLQMTGYKRPETGYLTDMLMKNWFYNKELQNRRSGFDPSDGFLFLNWLVHGRQKAIIKNLKKGMAKDAGLAEIYSYLKKLSGQYVSEKMPAFGSIYGGVLRTIYQRNKELYREFHGC